MTATRPLVALVVVVLLGACQAAGPSTAPSAEPGASDGASTAPGASQAPVGSQPAIDNLLTLTLDTSGPIISPEDGPEGAIFALPAAGARMRDGGYALFIVWFGETDPAVWVTVSTSADGETWDVGTEPIFTDLGVGNPDPGPIPAGALQREDGSWLLYGWAADASNPDFFHSWRASAPDLDGPWTLDEARVLAPGLPGAWDSQMTAVGSVIRTADGYATWYEGQAPGNEARGDVGYATSTDGLAWVKWNDPASSGVEHAESDPVLRRGVCGEPSRQAIFQPQVERGSGGYLAVFGAVSAPRQNMDLFGAVSADGVNWRCGTPQAILRGRDIPGGEGIHTIASLPVDDTHLLLVVESLHGMRSELWRATVELAAP